MKKKFGIKPSIALGALLITGCTTVKDTNGKDAGTRIGLPCVMCAALGHPMVVQAPAPASMPAAANTQAEQTAANAEEK